MLITELIARLEKIRAEHGEVQVWEYFEDEIDFSVMNISEMIKQLKELREKHGDLKDGGFRWATKNTKEFWYLNLLKI